MCNNFIKAKKKRNTFMTIKIFKVYDVTVNKKQFMFMMGKNG